MHTNTFAPQTKERPFLLEWITSPLRVAAIAPSSNTLARIITSEIGPETGPVIELGPGTGVFTRALLARGVLPENLALVELGDTFAIRLREKFPNVKLYHQSATDLNRIDPFDEPVGAVVSGLGLLAMPDAVVDEILAGVFGHLAPAGAFYQFTYRRSCPVNSDLLEGHALTAERIGKTRRNLPPASVYKITKA